MYVIQLQLGKQQRSWLKYSATNREVAGSFPDGLN